MSDLGPETSSPFLGPRTHCAHCKAEQPEDVWEVLGNDEVHTMTCVECKKPFCFETRECLSCGHETSTSWAVAPTDETQRTPIACGGCGKPVHRQNGDDALFDVDGAEL